MKFASFLALIASSGVRADVELGTPCATVSNNGDDIDGSAIVIYSGEEVDNMRRSDKYKVSYSAYDSFCCFKPRLTVVNPSFSAFMYSNLVFNRLEPRLTTINLQLFFSNPNF